MLIFIGSSASVPTTASAQQATRPFTVHDDIGLTLFGSPTGGLPPKVDVHFSADKQYVAVWSERGRLDLNRVEDSLRIYRSQDVENFLQLTEDSELPSPIWVVNRSEKEGPVISNWRWLEDSSGVAFLERTAGGNQRLVLADLRKKTIEPLTSATERVKAFDVHDRQHYVYTVADFGGDVRKAERDAPAIVGTGRTLADLLFPDDPVARLSLQRRSRLWAVVGSKRFQVKDDRGLLAYVGELVLSPSNISLVTTLPVLEVPSSWETLYPPSYPSAPRRIHAGHQDAQASVTAPLHQYVRIDLRTGMIQALTDAPISNDVGLWASVLIGPSWSSDGQAILLPGTYLSSKDQMPSRPCVVVVDLHSNIRTCVEMLKGLTETGREENLHLIENAQFVDGLKQQVIVSFQQNESLACAAYEQSADGTWKAVGQCKPKPQGGNNGLEVSLKQDFKQPPLLIATNKLASRVIWDPNPELKDVELGQANVYTWKDDEGRAWKGGLFMPSKYRPGQRYPLVIQTHGFTESEFIPSGSFPTAFAARELAATGIVVLQIRDAMACSSLGQFLNQFEVPCAVAGYQSAANHLVSDGLVDPERIGIIGFSRTCLYVMADLTSGSSRVKAASITDGVMADYLQYMVFPGTAELFGQTIGAQPFGEGLQLWLKRSPGFNLDKMSAALLVVSAQSGLLFMWQPYAGLRYLHKPVELIKLNTDEHVLTNPAVRMASQGGSVDWFCFWLKGEEDPDPAKKEQYVRWRELRKLQEENEKKGAEEKSKLIPQSVN